MKTLNEVIKAAHHCGLISGFDYSYEYDGGCPYEDCSVCEQKRMLGKDVIRYLEAYKEDRNDLTALRAYWAEQQENKPLTWQELKQMEGKPVWVEVDGKWWGRFWAFVEIANDTYVNFYQKGQEYPEDLWKRDIGKTWQAYRKERE